MVRVLAIAFALAFVSPALAADMEPELPAEAGGTHGSGHGDAHGGGHGDAHSGDAHAGAQGAAHAGDAHGGGHGGGEELNVADFSYKEKHKNPPLVLALINFGLLLALLGWKAAPVLREYWATKSNTIRDGLEEGATLRKEAEAKLEEYTQRIKDVDSEVSKLIADIRAEAEEEKSRVLADAKAQAESTKKAAEARIAAELQAARADLEREVVQAAVRAAETVLRSKVGPQDHQHLVKGFIASLEESATSGSGSSPS